MLFYCRFNWIQSRRLFDIFRPTAESYLYLDPCCTTIAQGTRCIQMKSRNGLRDRAEWTEWTKWTEWTERTTTGPVLAGLINAFRSPTEDNHLHKHGCSLIDLISQWRPAILNVVEINKLCIEWTELMFLSDPNWPKCEQICFFLVSCHHWLSIFQLITYMFLVNISGKIKHKN